ncbi:hypothetical protein Lal_00018763, partial [Lupinus albus]
FDSLTLSFLIISQRCIISPFSLTNRSYLSQGTLLVTFIVEGTLSFVPAALKSVLPHIVLHHMTSSLDKDRDTH